MHCLSIVFNAGSPVMWKLVFRAEENAIKAYGSIREAGDHDIVELRDDFGQTVLAHLDRVAGVMLENLEESKLAHIEMQLYEAKARAAATKRAQSDPELRTAGMMHGGMPILSPMAGGRM